MIHARAYRLGKGESTDRVKTELAVANPGSLVQVAKQGSTSNIAFVEMLAAQTFRAEAEGTLLAKRAELDLLLRLAGTTQISKAIGKQGAVPGEGFLAINAGRSELAAPARFKGAEIPRRALSEDELLRVETAALLDAEKG